MEGFWEIYRNSSSKESGSFFEFKPNDTPPPSEPPKEFKFFTKRMEDEMHLKVIKLGLLYELKANITK